MANKKQALMLSYISFLSFAVTGALTTFFLVNSSPFNLVSDSLTCIKIVSIVVSLLTALTHALNCHYAENFQLQIQVLTVVKIFLFLICFSFFFHFTAILFGAPFFEKTAETFHFAILMTVLFALPCCLSSGPYWEDWLDIFMSQRGPDIETVVCFSTMGALIGGWFGAVPIPLDWDRPWQAWPITCCVGALTGYSGGLLLAAVYIPHKFQQLNKSKRT